MARVRTRKLLNTFHPFYSCQDKLSIEEGCLLWGQRVIIPKSSKGNRHLFTLISRTHHWTKMHCKSHANQRESGALLCVRTCNICSEPYSLSCLFFTPLLNFLWFSSWLWCTLLLEGGSVVYCITVQGTQFAYPRHACIHSSGCPRVQALKAEQDLNRAWRILVEHNCSKCNKHFTWYFWLQSTGWCQSINILSNTARGLSLGRTRKNSLFPVTKVVEGSVGRSVQKFLDLKILAMANYSIPTKHRTTV